MAGNDPFVQDANIRDSTPSTFSYRASYAFNVAAGRSDTANFPVLTNATNPGIVDGTAGFPAVLFNNGNSASLLLNYEMPGEFDPDADRMIVDLTWRDPDQNDTAIGFAVSLIRGKAPLAANERFVNSAAAVGVVPAAITTPGANTHDATAGVSIWRDSTTFSLKGLLPYDALCIKITPQGNTNDHMHLWSGSARIQRHAALRYQPDRFN